jgi:plasmid replication initiation protein
MRTATAKASIQQSPSSSVIRKGLAAVLPTSIQKSYFLLKDAERDVLNRALEKYRPGQSGPILVGDFKAFKPALRLMTSYRLVIEEIKDAEVITNYTRWVDAVQVRGVENQDVYLTFSPRFEHMWLESKKRFLKYVAQKPADIGLRSQYALRLYSWAKKYVTVGTKRISLEELRKVLGLESVKDADGKIIQEAPLRIWANLRQRALDTAIAQINKKTDLNIVLESLERALHRRVTTLTFAIRAQATPNSDSKGKVPLKTEHDRTAPRIGPEAGSVSNRK